MKHLVDIENYSKDEILKIVNDAKTFKKKLPPKLLDNKLLITLFFEPSTRTRSSFEVAAKRLGASVVHLDPAKSSTKKGESIEDTFANLCAMGPDGVIIRHSEDNQAQTLANMNLVPVINAGTGKKAHPTQALLDFFTIYEYFNGNVEGKNITIVGDIANSRVASSNIKLLKKFNLNITLVAPKEFMPETNLNNTDSLEEGIKDADIIMSLRAQLERHAKPIFEDYNEYAKHYCIKKEHLKNRAVMHPGPVMRNIDISDEVLSMPNSLVLEQVKNGVFVRMAVLKHLLLDS